MKDQPLPFIPFREVRHDQPDDGLHYEPFSVRGVEMNWTIPAHRHEGLHQFQLLEHGRLRGTIDGQDMAARGPALLMLAPGSVHAFSYTPDAVGHQMTIPTATLAQGLVGSDLIEGRLDGSFVITELREPAHVSGLFHQLALEFGGRAPGRVHALAALASLIAVHFVRERGVQFERERAPGVRDTLVQRFLNLMERHYAEHCPLDFYADTLGVTPDHLSRSCRRVARKSALQLLHERLMLEARRLLAYTAMPVNEVADQLGYADPAYFCRVFGRAMGHTPSRYRARVAQGVSPAADR